MKKILAMFLVVAMLITMPGFMQTTENTTVKAAGEQGELARIDFSSGSLTGYRSPGSF